MESREEIETLRARRTEKIIFYHPPNNPPSNPPNNPPNKMADVKNTNGGRKEHEWRIYDKEREGEQRKRFFTAEYAENTKKRFV